MAQLGDIVTLNPHLSAISLHSLSQSVKHLGNVLNLLLWANVRFDGEVAQITADHQKILCFRQSAFSEV